SIEGTTGGGFAQTGANWIVSPTENNPPFSATQFATDPNTVVIPGTGANSATWTFNNLPAGTYLVSGTWVKRGDRATNTLFEGFDGAADASSDASVRVSQRHDPSRYNFGPNEWQHLFLLNVTGNTATIRVSDLDANGTIAADAVRLEPVSIQAGNVIDNGLSGEYAAGGYTLNASGDPDTVRVTGTIHGLFGDADRIPSDFVGTAATWTYNGLADGRYLVSATWTPSSENSMNAQYTVNGGGAPTVVDVDQELGPHSFQEEDITWQNLTYVDVTGGTLTVELSNNSAGSGSNNRYIVADAIRISPAPAASFSSTVSGTDVDNGDMLDFGTTRLGERADREITITNNGLSHLQLSNLQIDKGLVNTFDIFEAFELPGTGTFGDASIPPGGSTTLTVRMNADNVGRMSNGEVTFNTNDLNNASYSLDLEGRVSFTGGRIVDDGDAGPPVVFASTNFGAPI
ncbi:MAG: hypothetical protein KDA59_25540, partial [Planctomycetales bacterium]|nr:hypothetical protein [Planctomycetales bacterium]